MHLWQGAFLICLQTTHACAFPAGRSLSLRLTRSPRAAGTRWTACKWAWHLLCTARTAQRLRAARGAGSSLLRTVRRGVFSRTRHSGAGPCPCLQPHLWLLRPLLTCLHEQRSAALSGKSTPQTCLCLLLGTKAHFCYCFQKDSLKPFGSDFRKQTNKKPAFSFHRSSILISNDYSSCVQGMIHVFHFNMLCYKRLFWKFHEPFAIFSFVLYYLFYASPVDDWVSWRWALWQEIQ